MVEADTFSPATFSLDSGNVIAVETSKTDPKVRLDATGIFATDVTGAKRWQLTQAGLILPADSVDAVAGSVIEWDGPNNAGIQKSVARISQRGRADGVGNFGVRLTVASDPDNVVLTRNVAGGFGSLSAGGEVALKTANGNSGPYMNLRNRTGVSGKKEIIFGGLGAFGDHTLLNDDDLSSFLQIFPAALNLQFQVFRTVVVASGVGTVTQAVVLPTAWPANHLHFLALPFDYGSNGNGVEMQSSPNGLAQGTVRIWNNPIAQNVTVTCVSFGN